MDKTMLLKEKLLAENTVARYRLDLEHAEKYLTFISQELGLTQQKAETEAPAPTPTKTKKAAKAAPVEIEAPTEESEDDLDAFLGEKEDAPSITEDDVRALLAKIVKSKGDAGKKKCRDILAKFTKNNSALVKDLTDIEKAHAALTKLA